MSGWRRRQIPASRMTSVSPEPTAEQQAFAEMIDSLLSDIGGTIPEPDLPFCSIRPDTLGV